MKTLQVAGLTSCPPPAEGGSPKRNSSKAATSLSNSKLDSLSRASGQNAFHMSQSNLATMPQLNGIRARHEGMICGSPGHIKLCLN